MTCELRGNNILSRSCEFCGDFCETMYDLNLPTSKPPVWACYSCFVESFDNEMRNDFALKRLNIGGMEFAVVPDEEWCE